MEHHESHYRSTRQRPCSAFHVPTRMNSCDAASSRAFALAGASSSLGEPRRLRSSSHLHLVAIGIARRCWKVISFNGSSALLLRLRRKVAIVDLRRLEVPAPP